MIKIKKERIYGPSAGEKRCCCREVAVSGGFTVYRSISQLVQINGKKVKQKTLKFEAKHLSTSDQLLKLKY